MSNASDDKLVDDYLSGATPYSARYRETASADVPPELDAAVLEHAKSGQYEPKRRSFKWVAPVFAIAATAVLTLSMVLRSGIGTSGYRAEGTAQNEAVVTAQLETQSSSTLPEPSIALQAPAAAVPKAKEDSGPRETESQEKERQLAFPESKVATNEDVLADKKAESSRPPAAPPASLGAERRVLQESVPTAPSTQIASADPSTRAGAAQRAEIDRLTQKDAREKQKTEVESVVVTGTLRRSVPEDMALPVEVITSEELQQQGKSNIGTNNVNRASPARWLKYIRELRASGNQVEADAEWKRFVQTFPKYPVARNDSARPK